MAWDAVAYERGRPSYSPEAVDRIADRLALGPGRRVLDLGAGTGKLTRALAATGAEVVAVEPDAAMRAALPEALDGRAEAIPLGDGSVDAVTVGQAFHWFDPEPALAEIARVLRPGGGLALVWNERDESIHWVAEFGAIFDWQELRPYGAGTDWAAVIGASGRFGPVAHEQLRFEQELDEDAFVDRALSTSYVGTWSDERRAEVERRVRDLVAGFPAVIRLPHVTDIYWCTRSS